MLDGRIRGYAVMNKELTAYSFSDESLERCKRYCHKGYVIVEQIPYVNGLMIRICFYKPWKLICFERNCNQFNIGWLHVQWMKEYEHKIGKIVFKNE